MKRYVFKPTVLQVFGRSIVDVPSHSWLHDPENVIAMIEGALQRGDVMFGDDDPFFDIPPAVQVSLPTTKPAEPITDKVAPPTNGDWQTFRFKKGTSVTVWRIALRGNDVVVNYGRSGTKGQNNSKRYDDEAKAKRAMNKLILEKTRKG